MGQTRSYKTYNKEFKEESVSFDAEAAKSLGIGTSMLYKWKQHIEDQQSGKAVTESEREELKKLRKEVKNLRMEKEILKKASAFFAKEMK